MKQGVFWVLQQRENKIQKGNFRLLTIFDSRRGHYEIWEEIIKKHKELSCFDYETFPRGRVWKAEPKPVIFLKKEINTPSVLNKIDEVFSLGGNYDVQEDE